MMSYDVCYRVSEPTSVQLYPKCTASAHRSPTQFVGGLYLTIPLDQFSHIAEIVEAIVGGSIDCDGTRNTYHRS